MPPSVKYSSPSVPEPRTLSKPPRDISPSASQASSVPSTPRGSTSSLVQHVDVHEHSGRPTTLDHLRPVGVDGGSTEDVRGRRKERSSSSKLSPRVFRKLHIVKSGISFVNNLKLGE